MRYSAFISYNHRDRAWAAWLHRALERYRIPKALHGRMTPVGSLAARLPPVFRDREELATSADLAQSIQEALAQAATLIVICSPNAARSKWVNEEVKTFIARGLQSRILCLVVAGEPGPRSADDPLACFPPALWSAGIEPLAADVRPDGDGKQVALLKLIAGMAGVGYDDLRRRDAVRRQRQLLVVAGLSTAGLVGTSALAVFALISRQEAIEQRDIARQRTTTAERTVEFVKSMFAVSDPSEAKGATITAREILDRGARRISSSLGNEPAVKIELLTTLGEVYTGLGLFRQGDALIRSTFRITGGDPRSLPRQYAALGESQTLQADYASAIGTLQRGLAVARDSRRPVPAMEPRLLEGISEAHASLSQFPAADRAAQLAIRQATAEFGAASPETASARETLGLSAFFAGDLDRARSLFQTAIVARLRQQGALHPKVIEDLNMLGSIAYLQRDNATAERYFRQVLANAEVVLGPNHPDVASFLANLGRVLVERRRFDDAEVNLTRANAIYAQQRDATHDDLAFTYANLGLAQRELGRVEQAEDLLTKAIAVARLRKHRNLAPAMADLADTLCVHGDVARGLALANEARPIMSAAYPNDPWRVAWVDFVRGTCLSRTGQLAAGAGLLRANGPALLGRWSADTFYGAIVRTRLKALPST